MESDNGFQKPFKNQWFSIWWLASGPSVALRKPLKNQCFFEDGQCENHWKTNGFQVMDMAKSIVFSMVFDDETNGLNGSGNENLWKINAFCHARGLKTIGFSMVFDDEPKGVIGSGIENNRKINGFQIIDIAKTHWFLMFFAHKGRMHPFPSAAGGELLVFKVP